MCAGKSADPLFERPRERPHRITPHPANRFSEGTGGFGWLSPLTVQADHVYMLYVVNTVIGTTPRDFQVQWTRLFDEFGAPDNTILDRDQLLILPVELITFDAKPMADDVLVSWSTATERTATISLSSAREMPAPSLQ